jgi:hypothetical protein
VSQFVYTLMDPAANYAAVTPADNTLFVPGQSGKSNLTKRLYVGSGGDVVALMEGLTAVTFKNVPAGTVLPIRCVGVAASGTTAGSILRLW